MNNKLIAAVTGLIIGNLALLNAEETIKSWSWNTEAGYVQTTGNSKSESANANTNYQKKWTKTLLTVKGTHLSAKQDNSQSAESYSASEKGDLSVSRRFYVYELVGWGKDRFAGIDHRYNGQAGLGYKILDTKIDQLDSELGADYTTEEYLSGIDNDFASARGYLKYNRTLSDTSQVTQELEVLKNLEDGDDLRNTSISALSVSINTNLALKLSYTVKYDREPTPGFKKTDTILATALILKL
ncbi:MAG: DUF481 domain-containing protein [bacterium]